MKSLNLKGETYQCFPYGDHWFRIIRPKDNKVNLTAIGQTIYSSRIEGLTNIISTASEISIQTDHIDQVLEKIETLVYDETQIATKTYRLPINFSEHPDWKIITEHTGLSKIQYIEALLSTSYQIDMLGFVVGFYYCKKLDKKLQVPRKSIPSTQVEPGSIAVAADYLGIYSLASPGGWNIIGKTPLTLLDIDHYPPTKMNVLDKLQLEAIDLDKYKSIKSLHLDIAGYNAGY